MRVFERGGERIEIDVVEQRVVVRHVRDGAVEETADDAASEPVAKWNADRLASGYIEQGFVRVDAGADTPSQDELIEQLARDPEDLDTYLVLADWLDERGDPWGRVIAVQTAIARLPKLTRDNRHAVQARRDELTHDEARLLFQHAGRLWGALGDTIVNEATQTYAVDVLRPVWYCGFVRAVSVLYDRDGLQYVRAFADLDIARLLQSLTIRVDAWGEDALALLARRWPQLRKLDLHSEDWDGDPALPLDGVAIARFLDDKRAPLLQELEIGGSRNTDAVCRALAEATAPRLRSIALHGSQLGEAGVAALAAATFDGLEQLVITGSGPPDSRERLRGKAKLVRVMLNEPAPRVAPLAE
jgi:uncharacterized protein (TIGR02996 family)